MIHQTTSAGQMIYGVAADTVVLVHFFGIAFLFLGGIWGVRSKAIRILHIAGLAFAFVIGVFDWYCPLTYLEVYLRTKSDPTRTYTGSFIIHYVEKLVYIDLARNVIVVSTILLCGLNAWLYLRRVKI